MRRLLLACFVLLNLPQPGQAQEAPAKPGTYVLIAAVGDTFHVVTEVINTGSHLEPYHRTDIGVADNILNKLVLQDLDRMVEAAYPGSNRIAISLRTPNLQKTPTDQRPKASIDAVIAYLKTQQRSDWERIIAVTPAYRALAKDDLGTSLQGFGLFRETQCQANPTVCDLQTRSADGLAARTLTGEPVFAHTFVAPFSFITVWQIDPANLDIIDKREVYDHQKLSDDHGEMRGVMEDDNKTALAQQMIRVLSTSIHDALKRTDITGRVEVRNVHEVAAPEPAPSR